MRQFLTKGLSLAVILGASALPGFAIGGFAVTNVPNQEFAVLSGASNVTSLVGDYDGDGMDDVALTGNSTWNSVPLSVSNGDGTFQYFNSLLHTFPYYVSLSGAIPLAGDFSGDGKTDLAAIGAPNWSFVPMAFSNGNGTFTPSLKNINDFAGLAALPGARPFVGDFNGDGKADMALTCGFGWNSVPVAFSNGDGTFNTTNWPISHQFGFLATRPNVRPLVGDYNHDGKADIALTGVSGWNSIPVAFSNGDGTFNVTNTFLSSFSFPSRSSELSTRHLVGDYNHDGRTDIALAGNPNWGTLLIAFSNGDGSFNVTMSTFYRSDDFAWWMSDTNGRALVGDFNGDGRTDLAATGASYWSYIPIGFSLGDGTFSVANVPIVQFAVWSNLAFPLVGDYNGDGKADVALDGNSNWGSLPVAFSLTPAN